jgi:hypothetical protein
MPIDYAAVRGVNYVGSWAANPVAQWRFYDAARVELELGYLASIGVNAVRVWLSFAVWEEEGQGFLAKVADLLEHAASRGIAVMLVVWDTVGKPPSASPYDDLTGWVSSPGTSKVADPAFLPVADQFVIAVVGTAATSPAEVIWDAMNEPDTVPVSWVLHQVALLKGHAPDGPVTIGYFSVASAELTAPVVDVISFHPYGIYRRNVSVPAQKARAIAAALGGKPILATEVGFPGGGGQRYEDVLDYLADAELGFFLFQAMIGDVPGFPWKTGTGLFFVDGSVRDLEAVRALQSLAKAQGVPPEVFPPVLDPESPLWVSYAPIPYGFGAPENAALFTGWAQLYGSAYPTLQEAWQFYHELLNWTFASFYLADVLTPEELEEPAAALDAMEAAAKESDWEAAETFLTALATQAAEMIVAADLAEPLNRPPEILAAGASPNPFPGGGLRIEAAVWDPDGIDDLVVVGVVVSAPGGPFLFGLPLLHEGSGIFALEAAALQPLEPGVAYELLFVALDATLAQATFGPVPFTGA